jgi:TatD DNase family protein
MGLLVDCHCHLDHKLLIEDIEGVIERAKQSGITSIITAGIDPKTNRKALELSKNHPMIKASLGVYPMDALRNEVKSMEYPIQLDDFDLSEEIEFIKKNAKKIIAIGEVGLDFQTGNEREEQKKTFSQFIELAEKLDKPIIVHSRKSEQDCVEMLESSTLKKVVMHCFSGRFSLVKKIVDRGWYLTIPTNIVRSEHFQKITKEADLSRLLTETDAPYLSPFKDRANEPSFIIEAVRKIAELKQMEAKEVENNIYYNYERIFL